MKRISMQRKIAIALIIISAIFIFQLASDMIGYQKARSYISKGNYTEASLKLEKLDGYRDSEILKEYCDIMIEYNSADFTSIYHSYRELQGISEKLDASSLTSEFTKDLTEIETLYHHYNVLLYAN